MTQREDSQSTGRVLFCGAFKMPSNGTVGGVLFACRSLLKTSAAQTVTWELIDSAQPLPPPPFLSRVFNAIARIGKSSYCLVFKNIRSTLVFTPFLTFSLLEKLSICLLSASLGKPTCIAFRSEIFIPERSRWILRPLLRFTLERITCVICQSDEARNSLHALFPNLATPVEVIPNWTNLEDTPSKSAGQSFSDQSICRISYIGWLEPIKDVGTILSALASVDEVVSPWKFVVCGSGSEEQSLKIQAEQLGLQNRVQFLGWIDAKEKKERLGKTDLFVMASLSEGMPNSLVEAMSYGIPVVSSTAGGIPSLVRHESGGLLFPPGDSLTAAKSLQRMLSDAEFRRQCGSYNRKQIEQMHDAEKSIQRILRLLKMDIVPNE